MQTWQLPEYIADILPATARQIENARAQLLELFRVHGFELVYPPFMEYTTSLMAKSDPGLSLKTVRLVDQLSGLQLGLRADTTPQVARIDAHLLSATEGVNRLCYIGTVVHARPDGLLSTREPLQIGAEIYGYAGLEADIEVIDLMLKTLDLIGVEQVHLSLGHIGVFRALANAAQLPKETADSLLSAMQSKDEVQVESILSTLKLSDEYRKALALLPKLYGGAEVIEKANKLLPPLPEVQSALLSLKRISENFAGYQIHIDLAELRVDSYHSGLLFAAYAPGWPDAIVRGGRYDSLGAVFGRARPATGFSLDLRNLVRILPKNNLRFGIKVAAALSDQARDKINELRQAGESVVIDYIGQTARSMNCNRELVWQGEQWHIVPCA